MVPIDLEVMPVNRKEPPAALTLPHPDQGGIGQIHRQVAVLPHQHTGARIIVLIDLNDVHV